MSNGFKLRFLGIPVLSALFQLFIELVARNMEEMPFGPVWIAHALTVPWFYAAIVCEILNFALWLEVLANHKLSKAFPLSATGYLLVLCISWFVFHEEVLPLQLAGGACILAGVWMIGTA